MFLARTVTRAKWIPKSEEATGEIPADAVTGDLRTRDNALSFWQCGTGTTRDLENAVLAVAAGRERVDKVEIVWVDDQELRADAQAMVHTDGRTPVTDLVGLHVDVYHLNYVRLGQVASRVVTAFDEGRYCRMTRARVRELLVLAVKEGRLKADDLHWKVRDQIQQG